MMRIIRGEFTPDELDHIIHFGGPNSALLDTTAAGIYRKLYIALPPEHPFKRNDVVYYEGAVEHPRIVKRAYHGDYDGEALVDVMPIDGNLVECIEARFYSKEITS